MSSGNRTSKEYGDDKRRNNNQSIASDGNRSNQKSSSKKLGDSVREHLWFVNKKDEIFNRQRVFRIWR